MLSFWLVGETCHNLSPAVLALFCTVYPLHPYARHLYSGLLSLGLQDAGTDQPVVLTSVMPL